MHFLRVLNYTSRGQIVFSRPAPCALRRLQSSSRGRAAVIGGRRRAEDLGSGKKALPDGA